MPYNYDDETIRDADYFDAPEYPEEVDEDDAFMRMDQDEINEERLRWYLEGDD